jgi:hypothetical protein
MTFHKPKSNAAPKPIHDPAVKEKKEDAKKALEKIDDSLTKVLNFQINYYYYVLSITAACIGFTISITVRQKLQHADYIMIVSLTLWIFSFYFGLAKVNKLNKLMFNFSNYLLGLRNNYEDMSGRYKQEVDKVMLGIDSRKSSPVIYLIFGLFLFLIWYVTKIVTN